MQEGWRSLTSVFIDEFASGVFILRGLLGETPTQLYFASNELAVAELVRIKQCGSGKYKVTFLEYQHELKAWITWNGNGSTLPTKLHHDDALQKTVISEARSEAKPPLKIRVSNSVFLCGAKVLIHCHDCGMDILRENFAVHTSNIHGYTPLGNPREITGRLLHKDWVPRHRNVDGT